MSADKATLVIGLGNPILGDDGVGWRVAQTVAARWEEAKVNGRQVEFEYLALGGLSLMERMEGYANAIVIDAMVTGQRPMGTVYCLPLDALPNYSAGHTTSTHDTSLQTALAVGRAMGLRLPQNVWVVAVEARRVYDFSEELSPRVEAAVPHAAERVLEMLVHDVREEKVYDLT